MKYLKGSRIKPIWIKRDSKHILKSLNPLPTVAAPRNIKPGSQFTRKSLPDLEKFERRRGAARTGSVV
jgi:hypothetical protein